MMRKTYIQFLRVISMFAVIATHVCTTAWTDFPGFTISGGALYRTIISVCHFAVPVFFMITGALMLNPNKQISLEKLFKKYILKYSLVILVFCWFFALLEEYFYVKELTFNIFITSFFSMLQGKSWAHMWYMYTLLGTMFAVPMLRFITKYAEKNINYICITGIIFLSFCPLIETYTGFKFGIVFPISVIYPFYMLIGFWIDNGKYEMNNKICIFLIVTCVVVLTGLSILNQYINFSISYAAYNSPIIVVFSVALFSIFKNSKFQESKITNFLDKISFGVYIVHMFWINILYKFIKLNPFNLINPLIGLIVLFIFISCLSIASSWFLKKIPGIKKLI